MREMALDFKLFDGWVNITPKQPGYGHMDVSYLFPDLRERYETGRTTEQIIDEMDEAGVEQAILAAGYDPIHDDTAWTLKSLEKYPDRFVGSLVVDPHRGMDGVRELESRVRNDGFRLARIMAFHTLIPYNDPRCYPLYAKCAELGIPITVNVGVPGPLVAAARFQDPINLDEICAFFPELTVIMAHGGEPWAELCVKLMLKWKNLYYMSSAFAPRHIPKPVVHYMNTRGPDKVMWASDYPLLGFERCAREIEQMDFRDDERRRKFGRDNARRVILGEE
jgi:predicted TIM-barrel fold metal-dependent hydrolase